MRAKRAAGRPIERQLAGRRWVWGAAPPEAMRARWNGALWSFLELFALCGFAFTQPVLDVMGRSPDFFLFRQAARREIVLLTVIVTIVPAVALWAIETGVGMVSVVARRVVHLVLRAGLLGVIALHTLKTLSPLRGPVLAAMSAVLAGGAAVALFRHPPVRQWLRYLTPAPLVFAVLFLVFSPVSDLVLPSTAGAGAATRTAGRAPVVMIFFDEFPLMSLLNGQGKIDDRLYPNFARLARESTWFRNTTGMSGFTPEAVPAMLSGRYPDKLKAPAAAQFPNTLFSLLADSHDLRAFETITALCPPDECSVLSTTGEGGTRALLKDARRVWRQIVSLNRDRRDVAESLQEETIGQRRQRAGASVAPVPQPASSDDVQFRWAGLKENRPARFGDFLASLDGNRPPTFSFIHLLFPHRPWRYLPSGLQYQAANRSGLTEDGNSWPLLHAQQRYLLQTVYTDGLMGQVFDRLEETGLYDKSLVVVAADHGISFVQGDTIVRQVSAANAHHVAWVPFFVKAPSQRKGELSDRNVQTVDVLPTVADLLGIEVPWRIDGVSAVGERRRRDGSRPFFRGGTHKTVDDETYLPKVLRGMAESIARPELGPEGLFMIGPHADLVGTRPEDHRLSRRATPAATLKDGLERYRAVDPRTGEVPAWVAGEITDDGGLDEPLSVAVAVNGTIGGVSEIFRWQAEEGRKFVTMVSDSLFVPGENRLDLYLVTRESGGVVLHPVRL